jgi:hypothetical protein
VRTAVHVVDRRRQIKPAGHIRSILPANADPEV